MKRTFYPERARRYIKQVHDQYILVISQQQHASLPAGLSSAPERFRSGVAAYPFSFSDKKPSNSRLGPAKLPQPGVDLVNMTASAGIGWIPVLNHHHSQTRRPISVEVHTCEELQMQDYHQETRNSCTRPRRSSILPTQRFGTGQGSYSFLMPFASIVPDICRLRSSKALKNTRPKSNSQECWLYHLLVVFRGCNLQRKSLERTIHTLSGSKMADATSK